jgi:serine/threonine-protein kinase
MSLGTPHYMSPEQAMGEREITPKSDVYALGCVLYEMLTGEPPFTGPTAQAIIARVMTESPRSLTLQRHTIPPHVEAAVNAALEKLPADRFSTAADFAAALSDTTRLPRAAPGAPAVAPASAGRGARLRDPILIGLSLVTVLALAVAALMFRRSSAREALRPVRFLFTGSDSAPVVDNTPWPAAISPDGGTLVYAVASPVGGTILYARRIDQLEGHPIQGTNGGGQVLFSPDGQWLAFEVEGKEKKVRLDGSAPVAIADGGSYNGADWTTTGELVVGATGSAHGLSHVNVAGGELAPLTRPDTARGERDHLWPIAFPDGRTIVFTVWSGALATAQLAMTSLRDGAVARLDIRGIRPLAVLDGNLVYLQADGAVMAVPVDAGRKRVSGRPVPVLDPVPVGAANNGNSGVFISRGGALVSAQASHRVRLAWLGRDGVAHMIGTEVRDFAAPRLSPDGRRIAVIVSDGSKSDVWIYDLGAGTLSRLTSVQTVTSVAWTRDGSRVVYSAAGRASRAAMWTQAVGTATAPELLFEVPSLSPLGDLAPDGRTALLQSLIESRWIVQRVALDSAGVVRPYSESGSSTTTPRISPDGRWAAVTGQESGAAEVYVRSFPDPTVKVQVSVGGGSAPTWGADGSSLYYLSGNAVIEARLATSPTLRVVSRDMAFRQVPAANAGFYQANFDMSRDGSRLVVPVSESQTYQLIVVPNWLTEFRERLAASGN